MRVGREEVHNQYQWEPRCSANLQSSKTRTSILIGISFRVKLTYIACGSFDSRGIFAPRGGDVAPGCRCAWLQQLFHCIILRITC